MEVMLDEYDPRWPSLFEREAERIRAALGDRALLIEHTGSTSVPGLAAKPTVDLLLIVRDSSDEPSYLPALEQAGYSLRLREPGWHEHRLLKGPDTDINLHVLSRGCTEADRILVFRNRLRSDRADRDLYARTKRTLAVRSWSSMDEYAGAKTAVIEEILSRAENLRCRC